jgi:SAM-dependent methyltransferase
MSNRGDWDRRYKAADHLFSPEPDDQLVHFVSGLAPGRALDLGSGEGRNSLWLAQQGWRVTAVDFSGVALSRLEEAATDQDLVVETVKSGIEDYLARGEQFDLVVLANVHPAPTERGKLLYDAARAVSPGGHLFLVGHHLESLGRAGPPDPERLYTEDRLAGALPGLEVLHERRVHRHRADVEAPVVDLIVWATKPNVDGLESG